MFGLKNQKEILHSLKQTSPLKRIVVGMMSFWKILFGGYVSFGEDAIGTSNVSTFLHSHIAACPHTAVAFCKLCCQDRHLPFEKRGNPIKWSKY